MRKPWVWITTGIVLGILCTVSTLAFVHARSRTEQHQAMHELGEKWRALMYGADSVTSFRQRASKVLEDGNRDAQNFTAAGNFDASQHRLEDTKMMYRIWKDAEHDKQNQADALDHEARHRFGIPAEELP